MFHRDKKHYVTAEIRKIPVAYLLNLEMTALDELEKRIEEEGKRSELARKWVAGLKRIKQTLKKRRRRWKIEKPQLSSIRQTSLLLCITLRKARLQI
ncbi:MAG: hypothetical protein IKC10_01755 [Alphaproteobacteria bacterium]|nr:hypothetical protein [Alphaproteobacteria bacterium]